MFFVHFKGAFDTFVVNECVKDVDGGRGLKKRVCGRVINQKE